MDDLKDKLKRLLPDLLDVAIDFIHDIATALRIRATGNFNPASDLVDKQFFEEFGITLVAHHALSREPFSKDKFEHAMERLQRRRGRTAILASRGNPGHDITIDGQKISLKTEAAAGIKADLLHISKFMELGKGEWSDKVEHLVALRARFFKHMESYDRIVTLRSFATANGRRYEMVEIPKALLLRARDGALAVVGTSRQNPKPGYCTVETGGRTDFKLYFDGGTERKLQIVGLRKDLCIVHATWEVPYSPLTKG